MNEQNDWDEDDLDEWGEEKPDMAALILNLRKSLKEYERFSVSVYFGWSKQELKEMLENMRLPGRDYWNWLMKRRGYGKVYDSTMPLADALRKYNGQDT